MARRWRPRSMLERSCRSAPYRLGLVSAERKKAAMVKILLLQGANLTFLGRREPEIYGSTTPADLDAMLQRHARDHSYQLEIFYTNIEGEAINRIYQAVEGGLEGLVINPAGFTYAGYPLKDCIRGAAP